MFFSKTLKPAFLNLYLSNAAFASSCVDKTICPIPCCVNKSANEIALISSMVCSGSSISKISNPSAYPYTFFMDNKNAIERPLSCPVLKIL